jgi:SAM-dependent methyltransferase
MAASNATQVAYWNGPIGKAWAKEQKKRDRDHRQITQSLLGLAAAKPGEHVLDIGCGSGTTTLMLAEQVGVKGSATGFDISAPMLEVARARAREAGSHAIFVEGDAADFAFEPEGFDLVFSQFGIMFFADPVSAFANLRKAVKQGGRVAFVCWRHPFENPWANVPERTAKPLLPPSAPVDLNAPGRYSFHNPDRTKSVLLQAGFHAPKFRKLDARVFLGNTAEEAASSSIDGGPLLRTLADCDEPTRAKVGAAVTERLAREVGPDGVYLTAGVWLVRARA